MKIADLRRFTAGAALLLALAADHAARPENALPQEMVFPAAGRFLVAGRGMQDPRFAGAVVLVLRHDRSGSAGLVLNCPTRMKLSSVFSGLKGTARGEGPVYFGGPVAGRQLLMLLRSSRPVRNAKRVLQDVFVTASQRVMILTAADGSSGVYRVYAGYAGWESGQLEREIQRGDWAVLDADADRIFHDDGVRLWQELYRQGSEIEVRGRGRMMTAG